MTRALSWAGAVGTLAVFVGVGAWINRAETTHAEHPGIEEKIEQNKQATSCLRCIQDCLRLTGGNETLCYENCRRYCG